MRMSLSVDGLEPSISLTCDDGAALEVSCGYVGGGGTYSVYDGSYEATPSSAEQVFSTGGKLMTGNFVVNPIPQNYGLITYNGSKLRVS